MTTQNEITLDMETTIMNKLFKYMLIGGRIPKMPLFFIIMLTTSYFNQEAAVYQTFALTLTY